MYSHKWSRGKHAIVDSNLDVEDFEANENQSVTGFATTRTTIADWARLIENLDEEVTCVGK